MYLLTHYTAVLYTQQSRQCSHFAEIVVLDTTRRSSVRPLDAHPVPKASIQMTRALHHAQTVPQVATTTIWRRTTPRSRAQDSASRDTTATSLELALDSAQDPAPKDHTAGRVRPSAGSVRSEDTVMWKATVSLGMGLQSALDRAISLTTRPRAAARVVQGTCIFPWMSLTYRIVPVLSIRLRLT